MVNGVILEQEDNMKEELTMNTLEAVNSPKHYNTGDIEVIDAIEDWKLGFNLGNAIKYIARADHKGNREQDLKKAQYYLNKELGDDINRYKETIELLEAENKNLSIKLTKEREKSEKAALELWEDLY
jgi:hypothetical protein